MAKSRAVQNVVRARSKFFGVTAGRYLSMSQLVRLSDPTNYVDETRPDGFIFETGKVVTFFGKYTIEIIPYVYDKTSPGGLRYLRFNDGNEEIEGYLQINLGLPNPENPNFPRPGMSNQYQIDNSIGGGGLGAAQAYPTPSH